MRGLFISSVGFFRVEGGFRSVQQELPPASICAMQAAEDAIGLVWAQLGSEPEKPRIKPQSLRQ